MDHERIWLQPDCGQCAADDAYDVARKIARAACAAYADACYAYTASGYKKSEFADHQTTLATAYKACKISDDLLAARYAAYADSLAVLKAAISAIARDAPEKPPGDVRWHPFYGRVIAGYVPSADNGACVVADAPSFRSRWFKGVMITRADWLALPKDKPNVL